MHRGRATLRHHQGLLPARFRARHGAWQLAMERPLSVGSGHPEHVAVIAVYFFILPARRIRTAKSEPSVRNVQPL